MKRFVTFSRLAVARALACAAVMAMPSISATAHAQTDEIQVYDARPLRRSGDVQSHLAQQLHADGLAGRRPFPGGDVANRSLQRRARMGVRRHRRGSRPGCTCRSTATTSLGCGAQRIQAARAVRRPERRRPHVRLRRELRVQRSTRSTGTTETLHVGDAADHRLAPEPGRHHHQPDPRHCRTTAFEESRLRARRRASRTTCPRLGRGRRGVRRLRHARRLADRRANQVHQLFAVVDHTAGSLDIEAGAGFGLNRSSDKMTFKLILSRDLNKPLSKTLNKPEK